MTTKEWVTDKIEELRVRWMMLDAQAKQMIVLAAGYAIIYTLDVASHVLRHKLTRSAT